MAEGTEQGQEKTGDGKAQKKCSQGQFLSGSVRIGGGLKRI